MSKRLHARLNSLESTNSIDCDLTGPDKKLLVGILAKRDALLWPWRWQQRLSDKMPEIVRRQKEYLSGTQGILSKAEGTSWKTISDRRQRLIAAGLLSAAVSGGQVTSVFLTPKGESLARGLVYWLATFSESTTVLQRLLELSGGKANKPIRESILWDHPCIGSPVDWHHKTEMALPLLTAGVVRATSDTYGRIAYSIVAGAIIPEPEVPIDLNQQHEEAFSDLYLAAFNTERASLESCVVRNGLEIHIPLPGSGWGEQDWAGQ